MRFLVPIVAVVLSTGQFAGNGALSGGDGRVFSDLDNGHWETDGPPTGRGTDQSADPTSTHPYAHHDHTHIHDHAHGHHPHAPPHGHNHNLVMDGEYAGQVLHTCESDGVTKMEDACVCKQTNGLFQQVCGEGDFCDNFTGRCQKRSCFDACRWANPAQDDDGAAARDTCYEETCGCALPDSGMSEEDKCRLDCADCGPFPVDWPMSPEKKASMHENVMQAIFGSGLEHASDYNVRSMRPLETLSNILFTSNGGGGYVSEGSAQEYGNGGNHGKDQQRFPQEERTHDHGSNDGDY